MTDIQKKLPAGLSQEMLSVIDRALIEDIGSGDVTTIGTILASASGRGQFIAKSSGVIGGLAVAEQVFTALDNKVYFEAVVNDGNGVQSGQVVANISGPLQPILTGERTALNFLQRMSGIATQTANLVSEISSTGCRLLDTRKTVPGLRSFDKLAVEIGGGINHRSGLYDMVLIKDNHIEVSGSIAVAVKSVRAHFSQNNKILPIEVEVKNLIELKEALSLNIDRIMLDNMSVNMIKKAVGITAGKIPLEVSGNISLSNIKTVADTGVDFISVGAITHSVPAMDISLLISAE